MLSHVGWENDCMTINIPKHKGKQHSDGDGDPADLKHVYANPLNPLVCPMLWCAVYLMVSEVIVDHDGNNQPLFPGSSQGSRVGKELKKLLKGVYIYYFSSNTFNN
jgi:hypothetical protein